MAVKKTRINITIDSKILEWIDDTVKILSSVTSINRSRLIELLIVGFIESQKGGIAIDTKDNKVALKNITKEE